MKILLPVMQMVLSDPYASSSLVNLGYCKYKSSSSTDYSSLGLIIMSSANAFTIVRNLYQQKQCKRHSIEHAR